MARQELFVQKNPRGRPKGPVRPPTIALRLPVSVVDSADAWIASQPEPHPTRPEAIRRLVEKGLAGENSPDALQGLRTAILGTIDTAIGMNDECADELAHNDVKLKGIPLWQGHDGGPQPKWFVEGVKAIAALSDIELRVWLYETVDTTLQNERAYQAQIDEQEAKAVRAAAREAKAKGRAGPAVLKAKR